MRPPVFADSSLADAQARAADRFIVIDFTASWCGPCQLMDKNTWVDVGVVHWLNERAIALQLDVDTDEIAKQFEVRAMPTVVALRGGREFDRIVGYRNPDQLMKWFEGLEQGKTDLDVARERAAQSTDLKERFELARTLLMRGAPDEAAEHLVWLWNNALAIEPNWAGVRVSFLISSMREAVTSPKARVAIAAARDAAARGTEDWCHLTSVLSENDAVLAWFDETKAKGTRVELNGVLAALFMEKDRWKDLGELLVDPLRLVAARVEGIEKLVAHQAATIPEEHRDELMKHLKVDARRHTATIERALRAAGRDPEADQVAAEVKKTLG